MKINIQFFLLSCAAIVLAISMPTHSSSLNATLSEAEKQLLLKLASSTELAANNLISNPEAPIPPQCYTRTEGQFNPCYTCHQSYPSGAAVERPNTMNDGGLQGEYAFSDVGVKNHWENLFVDRTEAIAKISDEEILAYIDQDNYSAVVYPPRSTDFRHWAPDLQNYQLGSLAFDSEGHALDGSGWVAFNYKPLASTFWPTNGSTDDVLIRLPVEFRSDHQGSLDRNVYQANLAILELAIQQANKLSSPAIDESVVGVDLNNDSKLSVVQEIYPQLHYTGAAKQEEVTPLLYPQGTEFMHSVRYVGVGNDGEIGVSKRMKELRYMKKIAFKTPAKLRSLYINEQLEKIEERLPKAIKTGYAVEKPMGWVLSAYIEDSDGSLRYQTQEESFFCTGCHTSLGSTIDQTFSFARKPVGAKGWGYIDLKKLVDTANRGEQAGEYLTYLQRVGGGSEFRNNDEMQQRWFNTDGSVKLEKVEAASVYELITPSRERALTLNKAYKTIVEAQSFHHGRDATVTPPKNVYRSIDNHSQPLESKYRVQGWDIRPALAD